MAILRDVQAEACVEPEGDSRRYRLTVAYFLLDVRKTSGR